MFSRVMVYDRTVGSQNIECMHGVEQNFASPRETSPCRDSAQVGDFSSFCSDVVSEFGNNRFLGFGYEGYVTNHQPTTFEVIENNFLMFVLIGELTYIVPLAYIRFLIF